MIGQEIRRLKTGGRELRKFGLSVGGVCILLGFWFWHRHKAHYPYFLGAGSLLLGLGLAAPRSLKELYIGWMTLGFVLGSITSTCLLTVFFYLIVTPLGLAARCFGKDFLERRWDVKAPTYWRMRDRSKPSPPDQYERQF